MTTVKNWLQAEMLDQDNPIQWLREITAHGCISGIVSSLIYYHDTTAFYTEHEAAIWELLEQQYNDMGEADNIMQFIGGFTGAKDVHNLAQFKNMLAWWAVEETAYTLLQELEERTNG